MQVKIDDDFNLAKIANSGQCFRPKEIQPGLFRFVTGEHFLYIREVSEKIFDVSCGSDEWQNIWRKYFDLNTNYFGIRNAVKKFAEKKSCEKFLNAATDFGEGIRILRQDPFEMLISFIISQRKNIPAIRKSVESLCERFGREVKTEREKIFLFPTAESFCGVTLDNLRGLGLAYRDAYVKDAVEKINSHEIELDKLKKFSDLELVDELKKIRGVGDKVANCVALFAYHRVDSVPIDVWIKRAMEEDFDGENIFVEFGKNAGILQQYIFFFKRTNK